MRTIFLNWMMMVMTGGFLFAAPPMDPPPDQPPPRHARRMANMGNWVGRIAQTPVFAEAVGISDAQQETLRKGLREIEAKQRALEEKIRSAAREQARACRELLGNPDLKTDVVYQKIEEISAYRTEQAKLSIQSMLLIRNELTPVQREKADAFFQKMGKEHRQRMREKRRESAGQ